MKAEMPDVRIASDLLPRSDSGDDGVHDHRARELTGIRAEVGVGDHAARVVPHERRVAQSQPLDHAAHVSGERALVVRARRRDGATDSRQIDRYDVRSLGERRHDPLECRPVFGPAVQEQHRREISSASFHGVDLDAVDFHLSMAQRCGGARAGSHEVPGWDCRCSEPSWAACGRSRNHPHLHAYAMTKPKSRSSAA